MFFNGFWVRLSYTHARTAHRRKAPRRSDLPKVEFIGEWKIIVLSDSERHELLRRSSDDVGFPPLRSATSASTIVFGTTSTKALELISPRAVSAVSKFQIDRSTIDDGIDGHDLDLARVVEELHSGLGVLFRDSCGGFAFA